MDKSDSADELIIETDLTEEEKAEVKAVLKEREKHPENFVKWADIREKYLDSKTTE